MSDKTWKKRERAVAKRLNGNRIPVTGERAGADCETPLLCIQVKHGRRRPAFLADWIAGIRGNAQPKGKVGIVVWSSTREKQADAIVLMRLGDFEELHGKLPEGEYRGMATEFSGVVGARCAKARRHVADYTKGAHCAAQIRCRERD